MKIRCRDCDNTFEFPSFEVAEAEGWDVTPDGGVTFCPEHASKHDFVYCVYIGMSEIRYGVKEVNNHNECEAWIKKEFPGALRFSCFCHLGEEQEETL